MTTKTRWIPDNGTKVEVKNVPGAVVYLYTNRKGQLCSTAYTGKSTKPQLHYAYRTDETRTKEVTRWIQATILEHEKKAAASATNQDAPQTYLPGCIIADHWGYEQTNVDFYLITARKGDMVTLQQIGSHDSYHNESMTGTVMPNQDEIIGQTFKRKVHKYNGEESGIAIQSYGWARLWTGRPEHYSSYA
jgi:hypothetical protein